MSDRYAQLVNAPVASQIARRVGLPRPVPLERHRPGDPVVRGRVLLGAAPGGRLAGPVAEVLAGAHAALTTIVDAATSLAEPVRSAIAAAGLDATVFNPDAPGEQRFKALVFDATGIVDSTRAGRAAGVLPPYRPPDRALRAGVVLGTPPAECESTARGDRAARAGGVHPLARQGARRPRRRPCSSCTSPPAPSGDLASTLRFLLSPRSAYVSGQVVHVGMTPGAQIQPDPRPDAPSSTPSQPHTQIDWERPFAGRIALVTGASRGIGEAIASTLAREGAHVVGLDVPALAEDLQAGDRAPGRRGFRA